jgi:Mn2+/Fe2+ NRAMP family transporter
VISAALVLMPGIKLFPLMWLSQVANAVLLPVILLLMLQLANSRRLMRGWRNGGLQNVFVVVLVMAVAAATIAMIASG